MAAVIEFPAATAPSVGDLRARFREGKRALIDEFRAARPTAAAASRLIRTLCQHVDTALLGLWTHAAMPEGAGLVAVGGYGRGELFPHSDVDVLVLLAAHPAGTADAANASVEAFITACWDIGLEIGSSVRTVDDVPLDLVAEWVPAAIAGRVSRADAAAPGIWASLQRDGHRVASVRQTITAGIAGTSDAMLLDVAVGAPLLLVRRLARDEHKAPLALSDHRYLAHRFSLEVEFNGWPGAGADTPPGLHENETQAPADALGVAGVLPIQAGPGISHDLKESDS